jgi:hypothetical protein
MIQATVAQIYSALQIAVLAYMRDSGTVYPDPHHHSCDFTVLVNPSVRPTSKDGDASWNKSGKFAVTGEWELLVRAVVVLNMK